MTLTADFSAELTDRDFVFGAGTAYQFDPEGIAGFGVPRLRDSRQRRPQDHGSYPGPQYADERAFRWTLELLGSSPADAIALAADLAAAFSPIEAAETIELTFRLAGVDYLVRGVPSRCDTDYARLPTGTLRSKVEFVATDPRIYLAEVQVEVLTPIEITGGLALPHGFPHGFGSITGGGDPIINAGNFWSYPDLVTITAGVDGASTITLEHAEREEALYIETVLSDGDFLEVDFANRSVMLNGEAPRDSDVVRPSSSWWRLDVGTNTIRLGAAVGDVTGEIRWHHALML